jgi:predicted tellurium resistance membrane protein TerC
MLDFFSQAGLAVLAQVVLIDLVLAGDNAVVIGIAAAGLAPQQRRRAILVGILAATAMRIAFAFVALELLAIIGLVLAGGILLLWVSWKMWRELRTSARAKEDQAFDEGSPQPHAPKTFPPVLDPLVALLAPAVGGAIGLLSGVYHWRQAVRPRPPSTPEVIVACAL